VSAEGHAGSKLQAFSTDFIDENLVDTCVLASAKRILMVLGKAHIDGARGT
jgi:hypothetical protein